MNLSERSRRKPLQIIDLQTADHISTITGKTIYPGQRFYVTCVKLSTQDQQTVIGEESDMGVAAMIASCREDLSAISSFREQSENSINIRLTKAGFSPFKVQNTSRRYIVAYGKRKCSLFPGGHQLKHFSSSPGG